MKAAVLEGLEKITVKDVPEPKPEMSEVLIRVRACGICGTDLGIYKMGSFPGRIMGHEFSGEIVELGSGVEGWSIGDRVTVEPSNICWSCYWCKRHQYQLCPSLGYTGISVDGGFAEFVKVPAYQLHNLADDLTYEQGALVEPLAVALHSVWLAGLRAGDSMAVFGCGFVGLMTILWGKVAGAEKIIATEIAGSRIAIAEKLADAVLNPLKSDPVDLIVQLTDELGPDIIFECSGKESNLPIAFNAVRRGGQVIILGIPHQPTPVSFMLLATKEITLKGSVGYASLQSTGEFRTVINFLRSKRLDINSIPIKKVAMDDIEEKGFQKLIEGQVVKVVVTP